MKKQLVQARSQSRNILLAMIVLFFKKQLNTFRPYILMGLPLLLVAFGWYRVYAQSRTLEQASIKIYQEAQLEVVRGAARAASIYIKGELSRRGGSDQTIHQVEQETLVQFVKPIRIGTLGDAWIYSPEYAIFDESEDFPAEYIGKSMAEIFNIQKQHGAMHYEEMTAAVSQGVEGTGWYIWQPDKAFESTSWWEFLTRDMGREIAAWTPVKVFPGTSQELTWVIGMSAMLPEIMRFNGAYDQIQRSIYTMSAVTILVFALIFLLRRAEVQVQELRQQVEELRIEIDEAKKTTQVAEIVETEYFQDLAARARVLRSRRHEEPPHGEL